MRRALLRRVGLGVVDQVLSSTSNFVTTLVAARNLDQSAFGAFALAYAAYTVNVLVVRALCSEAMLVRPGDGPRARRRRAREAAGAAFWVGVVLGSLYVLVGGLLVDESVSSVLVVIGLLTPGLLLQDTMRYIAFAQGRPGSALVNDGFWLITQVAVLVGLVTTGRFSAVALLVGWGLVGTLAGVVQMAVDRLVPAFGSGVGWVRRNRDLSVRYLADMMSGQGASQIASYVLAGVAGVTAVGAIRGAQTLFGPVNILLLGSNMVLVPEGRKLVQHSTRRLLVACVGAGAVFTTVAAICTIGFLAVPAELGERVLGSTWATARTVVFPVGLAAMAGGMVAGSLAGLRSIAAADALLRTRLITTPAALALPITGALVGGAQGLAYGIALSVWWNVIWFWRSFLRALQRYEAERTPEATAAATP